MKWILAVYCIMIITVIMCGYGVKHNWDAAVITTINQITSKLTY